MDILRDAEDFLGAAKDLFETTRWSKVCFNCHQCVELAIKAALNALGLERKGHDLSELLSELLKYREDVKRFRGMVKILDQYYIPTRYANAFYSGSAMEHYTKNQAQEALNYAKKIFQEMRNIVTKGKTLERGERAP